MTTQERIDAIEQAAADRGKETAELVKKLGLDNPYMQRQRANAARYTYK